MPDETDFAAWLICSIGESGCWSPEYGWPKAYYDAWMMIMMDMIGSALRCIIWLGLRLETTNDNEYQILGSQCRCTK